jgi:hypothetical protein
MDGYATLEQLRNSPPGTVFRERRGAPFTDATIGGTPTQAEYRTAHSARRGSRSGPATLHAWLDALEDESREINRLLDTLSG